MDDYAHFIILLHLFMLNLSMKEKHRFVVSTKSRKFWFDILIHSSKDLWKFELKKHVKVTSALVVSLVYLEWKNMITLNHSNICLSNIYIYYIYMGRKFSESLQHISVWLKTDFFRPSEKLPTHRINIIYV